MKKQAILTVAEAAKRLGLSCVRVRQFCQQNRLGQKVGNVWIISESELRHFSNKPRPWGGPRKKKKN